MIILKSPWNLCHLYISCIQNWYGLAIICPFLSISLHIWIIITVAHWQMKTKLISAWNSVKYGKNGWTNAGDIFRCHKNQIHSLQHQQLSFFEGKASQRTRQFGFLASPITESWSLDLLTLNRGALSEIRSDPSYHHSDHSEDHYFQYLKPVSEIKHWI